MLSNMLAAKWPSLDLAQVIVFVVKFQLLFSAAVLIEQMAVVADGLDLQIM